MSGRGAARPRVLWVTDEPPDRDLGGGNIRQAHLIEGLSGRAETHLLLVGHLADQRTRAALSGITELPPVPLWEPGRKSVERALNLWLATAAPGPREAFLGCRRRRLLAPVLAEREGGFDHVVVTHQGLAALLPASRSARWTIQLHHVSAEKARQDRAVAPGRRQRFLHGREAMKAATLERWAVGSYDQVVVVSDGDAEILAGSSRSGAKGPVIVVPNGVDLDRYRPSPLPVDPRILLAGTLSYEPNREGARWFCREVLPLVQRQVPAARLAIVGREPQADVLALQRLPGVEVHGDVPSMVPWLAAARVTVVPLRVGTGTRLKALESLAAGRPVAGTSIGLAGLDLRDRVEARVADDAGRLAEAVVELLVDDAQAEAVVRAGRGLVERRYQWSVIADDFSRALLGLD